MVEKLATGKVLELIALKYSHIEIAETYTTIFLFWVGLTRLWDYQQISLIYH